MSKKQTIPDDEELKLEIRKTLIGVMRNATKERRFSYECEFHPKYTGNGRGYKHQINVPVEDYTSIIKACGELLDRMEGKAATKKEAPKVKTTGRGLDELSDEELEAIINGASDGGAA